MEDEFDNPNRMRDSRQNLVLSCYGSKDERLVHRQAYQFMLKFVGKTSLLSSSYGLFSEKNKLLGLVILSRVTKWNDQ